MRTLGFTEIKQPAKGHGDIREVKGPRQSHVEPACFTIQKTPRRTVIKVAPNLSWYSNEDINSHEERSEIWLNPWWFDQLGQAWNLSEDKLRIVKCRTILKHINPSWVLDLTHSSLCVQKRDTCVFKFLRMTQTAAKTVQGSFYLPHWV